MFELPVRSAETRIIKNGKEVPVVAFFGARGGVGKTTVARLFAEMVTLATSAPGVLLVDVDVYHRGMTVQMTADTPVSCWTIHDYIARQDTSEVEAANVSGTIRNVGERAGRLFFIPAATEEAARVFGEAAKLDPPTLFRLLHDVLSAAVHSYDCECVVIDCGPIIDPYTAAAATLANRAFIIGQNEDITFASLRTYPIQIREFYPEFSVAKMKVIINKVRLRDQLDQRLKQQGNAGQNIFAAIPFTLEIIDISEGLKSTGAMQELIFQDHIVQIVEKTFKADHPELIPPRQSLLPPEWEELIQNPAGVAKSSPMKRLAIFRALLPLGLIVALVGAMLFYRASTGRHEVESRTQLHALQDEIATEVAAEPPGSTAAQKLKNVLGQVQATNPGDSKAVADTLSAARQAGLRNVPPIRHLDTSWENMGVTILLCGIVITSIGWVCASIRKEYLRILRGIDKNGAAWLVNEMKSKRSTRKRLDRLVRFTSRSTSNI